MKTINTVVVVLSVMFFSVVSANASSHYDSVFTEKLVQRGMEDAVFYVTENFLTRSKLTKTVKVVDIQIVENYRTDQTKLEQIYKNLVWSRYPMNDNLKALKYSLNTLGSKVSSGYDNNDYKENVLRVIFQANFITEDGSKHKIVCGVSLVKFENKFLLSFPGGVKSRYRWKGSKPQNFEEKIRILHDYIAFLKDNE